MTTAADCLPQNWPCIAGENLLGEGPVWSPRDGKLYWVDIRAPALLALEPATGGVEQHDMPTATIGFVAPRTRGGLIVALDGDLHVYEPVSRSLAHFLDLETGLPDNRFNEGRCDRQGRLWAASMVDLARYRNGSLYHIGADKTVLQAMSGIGVPNSLAWSPDGETMYFADTLDGCIFAIDYDPDEGTLGQKRLFADADSAPGKPDGSAIDAEGCLWNARYGAGRVARFDPKGRVDRLVACPASQVTACTFGGARLDTLYVTSARQHMSADALEREPASGSLFAIATGTTGIADTAFAG